MSVIRMIEVLLLLHSAEKNSIKLRIIENEQLWEIVLGFSQIFSVQRNGWYLDISGRIRFQRLPKISFYLHGQSDLWSRLNSGLPLFLRYSLV